MNNDKGGIINKEIINRGEGCGLGNGDMNHLYMKEGRGTSEVAALSCTPGWHLFFCWKLH